MTSMLDRPANPAPVGRLVDQFERGRLGEGFAQYGIGDGGSCGTGRVAGNSEIFANRSVEQIRLLPHHRLHAPTPSGVNLRQWNIRQRNRAGIRIPVAHQQFQHR